MPRRPDCQEADVLNTYQDVGPKLWLWSTLTSVLGGIAVLAAMADVL